MSAMNIILILYLISMILLVVIGVLNDIRISRSSKGTAKNRSPSIKKYICCVLALIACYIVRKLENQINETEGDDD